MNQTINTVLNALCILTMSMINYYWIMFESIDSTFEDTGIVKGELLT